MAMDKSYQGCNMIEIIPNWHPIFVHFTIGLFSIAVVFYILAYLTNISKIFSATTVKEFEVTARWCLWIVAFITIGTVFAGLRAFNSVKHDEAAHIAMTIHRNWALSTAIGIILLAAWSIWRYYKLKELTITFILALLIVQALLLTTGWHGAELVYRHGLGVMSLPKEEGDAHQQHHHHNDDESMKSDNLSMSPM